MFDAFWRATGESPFDTLTANYAECYRLTIRTSLSPQHQVVRMQRPRPASAEDSRLIVHFFKFGPDRDSVSVATDEITLDEDHWHAMEALLAVARFWDMTEDTRCGLDGSYYMLEAWKGSRSHTVTRWSPNAVVPGGELFAVVTDYLVRLAELASFECGLYERYAPGYVPKRRPTSNRPAPRGNIG
jgi:hypothetical protein